MSKIVFVNPPTSLFQRYGYFAGMGNTLAPLGLLYLASVARVEKFDVAVAEASNSLSYEDSVSEILGHHPDYVAITATTVSIFNAARLARMIKERAARITIIIGGAHLSATPEETMQKFPAFDFGIIGEGEETLIELLKRIESKGKLGEVPGITFRETNKVILTPERPPIVDLDKLPFPAWDILPNFPRGYYPAISKFQKLPAAYILTSRGCPYNCIFCSSSVFKKTCRFFSHQYISEMIELLHHRYGIKEISFEDDTLFLSKERLIKICEFLLQKKLFLSWTCNSRADLVSLDILKLMKRAGCWQIGFGIETGVQDILDFSRKGLGLGQIEKAVALTRQAGIFSKGFFILGFPKETKKTLRQTIDFAKRIKLNDITVSFMTQFPGSELYRIAKQYGQHTEDWQKMSMLNTVFIPSGLQKKDLEKYFKLFLKEFYFRPKIILDYLLRIMKNPLYFRRILKISIPLLKFIFLKPKQCLAQQLEK
ncbi:MAG: radical SAM protein [Candidatus Omnitrophica bacterium]|nr:radical SAM protein [Candidatus Omnitrophota bacterium]